MKKLILYLFTICIGFLQMVNAQTVTGVVSSAEEGAPLPGINVQLKGTTKAVMTDLEGKYQIDVAGPESVLVFTFIGYATQEVTVGTQTKIDVSMQIDAETKEEVVVVGYGTQKRTTVTGAISSVNSKDIVSVPTVSADQALQGRVAGITVINNGSPGTAPTVRVRGLSTVNNMNPLIVIDGVIASSMSDVNANDIESVDVLKDASTASIYGSLGSNGVIMITTKKGGSGQLKIDYSSYWGQQWNNNKFDLLNVDQYIEYASAGDVPGTGTTAAVFTDPQYNTRLRGTVTDWQDEIRQNGFMQDYNLGISGGDKNNTYRVSMGYLSQDGTIKTTGYERFNFRANSDYTRGRLKIGESVGVSFSTQNPLTNSGGRSVWEHAIKSAPYLPVYNPLNKGGFQGPNRGVDGQDAENPMRVLELNSYELKGTNILGNIYAELDLIKGLKFKSVAGLENVRLDDNQFLPAYDDDDLGGTHAQANSTIRKNRATSSSYVLTQSLNYKATFADKHNLEALAAIEYAERKRTLTNASSQNTITSQIEQMTNTQSNIVTTNDLYRRIGYIGRLNYNFDQKYLFATTFRADASSRFGINKRWGYFPSFAAGWVISKESFMQDISVLSNLKLRASWGKAGNDKIADYGFAQNLTSNMNYVINNVAVVGTTIQNAPNPDLKWEETTMQNIGLDMGLLNNQFTLSAEYYYNKSKDLLMSLPTVPSLGVFSQNKPTNVGSVETHGVEIQLGYNDFEGDFQWSTSLNIGTSKNKALDIGGLLFVEQAGQFENYGITRLSEGESLFYFYGYKFDGVFSTSTEASAQVYSDGTTARGGDYRIVDVNGDGIITNADMTKIGNPFPDLTLGFNLNANYKGFDLGLFIQGSYGNDIYNTNLYDLQMATNLFNAGTDVLRRWRNEGDVTDIGRPSNQSSINVAPSTRYVENGSYTRLKNVTLGYTLPSKLFGNKISKLRVYVSATNLLTITDYSGLDPEIGTGALLAPAASNIGDLPLNANGYPTGNFQTGIDYGTYPIPKSFIGGIQITF